MTTYQSELYFCSRCKDYHELLSDEFGAIVNDTCPQRRTIKQAEIDNSIAAIEKKMKDLIGGEYEIND